MDGKGHFGAAGINITKEQAKKIVSILLLDDKN